MYSIKIIFIVKDFCHYYKKYLYYIKKFYFLLFQRTWSFSKKFVLSYNIAKGKSIELLRRIYFIYKT